MPEPGPDPFGAPAPEKIELHTQGPRLAFYQRHDDPVPWLVRARYALGKVRGTLPKHTRASVISELQRTAGQACPPVTVEAIVDELLLHLTAYGAHQFFYGIAEREPGGRVTGKSFGHGVRDRGGRYRGLATLVVRTDPSGCSRRRARSGPRWTSAVTASSRISAPWTAAAGADD